MDWDKASGLPHAFFPVELPGFPPGYPVAVDVNLPSSQLVHLQRYLVDGQYVDNAVNVVRSALVVLNQ